MEVSLTCSANKLYKKISKKISKTKKECVFLNLNEKKANDFIKDQFKALSFREEDLMRELAKIENLKLRKQIPIFAALTYKSRNVDGLYSHIERKFLDLLNGIEKLYEENKYYAFNKLIQGIKRSELINKQAKLIESKFIILLERLDEIHDRHRNTAFFNLISSLNGTNLRYNHRSAIEEKFLDLFIKEHKLTESWVELFMRIGVIRDKFFNFLIGIDNSYGENIVLQVYKELVFEIKSVEKLNESFPELLLGFDRLTELSKFRAFSIIVRNQKSGILKEKFTDLLILLIRKFEHFQFERYSLLIDEVEENERLENLFIELLKGIDKMKNLHPFLAISKLIDMVRGTKIIDMYFPEIKKKFTELITRVGKLPDDLKLRAFLRLIDVVNNPKLMNLKYVELCSEFKKLNKNLQNAVLPEPTDAIKGIIMMRDKILDLLNRDLLPGSASEFLEYSNPDQLIFLFSIVYKFFLGKGAEFSLPDALNNYYIIRDNLGLDFMSQYHLSDFLRECGRKSIVIIKIFRSRILGRRLIISKPDLELPNLGRRLIEILSSKGVEISLFESLLKEF
ncbi:hypothetical protein LCGC14_0681960 [marine sediment metagenome]|uniref:Uncharacterized protein n=1 Tax=marine sediment metagenome TaxID=412755 RepID=A0A0F9TW04_9ZZZZ